MTRDNYVDGVARRRIDQVRVGDRLDFLYDPFADPDRGDIDVNRGNLNPAFEFEFATVESIELKPHDTDPMIVLHTDQGSYGFPPDHEVEVDAEQVRSYTLEQVMTVAASLFESADEGSSRRLPNEYARGVCELIGRLQLDIEGVGEGTGENAKVIAATLKLSF